MMRWHNILKTDAAQLIIAAILTAFVSFIFGPDLAWQVFQTVIGG